MKKTETINSPIYSELDPNRKVIREIPSLRGENIKQFLMSDKTIQVAMYDEPVHLRKMEHGMTLIRIYIKQRKGDIKTNPIHFK